MPEVYRHCISTREISTGPIVQLFMVEGNRFKTERLPDSFDKDRPRSNLSRCSGPRRGITD